MKKSHARLAAILGSIAITAVLAACAPTGGSGGSTGGSGGSASGKVAFLMPDLASTRYEQQDSPLFTAKMKELWSGLRGHLPERRLRPCEAAAAG